MATLLLTAVGTAIGGPIGGAIGALVGQQVDNSIIGNGTVEGPRISDLSVTTSSYGQPIPRHFGTMRVPGTIIWSTELQESKETSSNGKGQPKTTTYSYSISFAVAISSRPISSIGRIWADGNLLRGSGGDLKVAGEYRLHNGFGDQEPDPLISAAIGETCPGFRDCAYVVFENLELTDFGNRIPALTFEVVADPVSDFSLADIAGFELAPDQELTQFVGFSDNGGPINNALSSIDRAFPLRCAASQGEIDLSFAASIANSSEPKTLPSQLMQASNEEAKPQVSERIRQPATAAEPRALRYFDVDRDFQTSVQRTVGVPGFGREVMLELPASMNAQSAREACNQRTLAARWKREQIRWEIAELSADYGPGSNVRLPDIPGIWNVRSWEWLERGIALDLTRISPEIGGSALANAGESNSPSDDPLALSELAVFELPWDGLGSSTDTHLYVAGNGLGANWNGAALYVTQDNTLLPLNETVQQRSVFGVLASELAPSPSICLEAHAECEIALSIEDAPLSSSTIAGLANGANRLLVGNEILQFVHAEPQGGNNWLLSGLLRGRGATEGEAAQAHPAGTQIVLLDESILALSPIELQNSGSIELAAIGRGDADPVYASTVVDGVSRRPLSPVHPRSTIDSSGNWNLCWTRRARGQWTWNDGFGTPLIEESERYLVGCGPTSQPLVSWTVDTPELQLGSAQIAQLAQDYFGQSIWVKQIGTFGNSQATEIATIA